MGIAKNTIIGTLLVLIATGTYFFIALDNSEVQINADKTKTVFYVNQTGTLEVSGQEQVYIYNGSKSISATLREPLKSYQEGNNVILIRTTHFGNVLVEEKYIWDSTKSDLESFPVSHEIKVINGTSYTLQYVASKLTYNGTSRNAVSPESFGKQMKVEWQDGYNYAKISKTLSGTKLTIKYKIYSNEETYTVRLFDPYYGNTTIYYDYVPNSTANSTIFNDTFTRTVDPNAGTADSGQAWTGNSASSSDVPRIRVNGSMLVLQQTSSVTSAIRWVNMSLGSAVMNTSDYHSFVFMDDAGSFSGSIQEYRIAGASCNPIAIQFVSNTVYVVANGTSTNVGTTIAGLQIKYEIKDYEVGVGNFTFWMNGTYKGAFNTTLGCNPTYVQIYYDSIGGGATEALYFDNITIINTTVTSYIPTKNVTINNTYLVGNISLAGGSVLLNWTDDINSTLSTIDITSNVLKSNTSRTQNIYYSKTIDITNINVTSFIPTYLSNNMSMIQIRVSFDDGAHYKLISNGSINYWEHPVKNKLKYIVLITDTLTNNTNVNWLNILLVSCSGLSSNFTDITTANKESNFTFELGSSMNLNLNTTSVCPVVLYSNHPTYNGVNIVSLSNTSYNYTLQINNSFTNLFTHYDIALLNNAVAYYKLDSITPVDETGRNNGTMVGYTFNNGTRINGQTGSEFDGVNDYINITTLLNLTESGSYGGWFKRNSNYTTSYTIDNYRGFYLFHRSDNYVSCQISAKGSAILSNSQIDSNYHNILCIFNSTGLYMYVDGVKQTAEQINNSNVSYDVSRWFTISRRDNLDSNYFNGSISKINIWNRALNSSEIAEDYAVGKDSLTPIGNGLVAQYILNNTNYSNTSTVYDINNLVMGRINNGYNFEGIDDRLSFTNTSTISKNNDFSISFWIKNRGIANGFIMANLNGGSDRFGIYIDSSNIIHGQIYNGSNYLSQFNRQTTAINSNEWTNIIYIKNSTNSTIYKNGVLNDNQGSVTLSAGTNTNLVIGTSTSLANYFNGSIDEVSIFNKTLSSSEIYNIYTSSVYYRDYVYNYTTFNVTNSTENCGNYTYRLNDADIVDNASVYLTSTGDPHYVNITINNKQSNYVYLSNDSFNDIVLFSDTLSSKNNTYLSYNTIQTNYFNIPKTAIVNSSTLTLTGYKTDVNYINHSAQSTGYAEIRDVGGFRFCDYSFPTALLQTFIVQDSNISSLTFKGIRSSDFDDSKDNTVNLYLYEGTPAYSSTGSYNDFPPLVAATLVASTTVSTSYFATATEYVWSLNKTVNSSKNMTFIVTCPSCYGDWDSYNIGLYYDSTSDYTGGVFSRWAATSSCTAPTGAYGIYGPDLYLKVNMNTYPKNMSVKAGLSDGSYDYINQTEINSSLIITNMTNSISSYLTSCNADEFGYCLVPINILMNGIGLIQLSNLQINYTETINPIILNHNYMNEIINSSNSSNVSVDVKFCSQNNATMTVSNSQLIYAGGRNNILINITDGLTVFKTYNLTAVFSGHKVSLPARVSLVEFIPKSSTSKNVTPYGQTLTKPIFNFTSKNYWNNATFYLIQNNSIDCVNLSYSFTNASNKTLLTNSTIILSNISSSYNQNIFLYADYNCNQTRFRMEQPNLAIFGCCKDCDICTKRYD